MAGNVIYDMSKKCNVISFLEMSLQSMVMHSPCKGEYPDNTDMLIGHEYEDDGRYHKVFFPATPAMLAGFIAKSGKMKMIANSLDYAVLFSTGKEIKASVLDGRYMNALYAELGNYADAYCDFEKLLAEYNALEEDDLL